MSSFSSFLGIPCRIAGEVEFHVARWESVTAISTRCGGNETRRNAGIFALSTVFWSTSVVLQSQHEDLTLNPFYERMIDAIVVAMSKWILIHVSS